MDDRKFEVFVSTMPGRLDAGIVVSAVRAGATGVLNLEATTSPDQARDAVQFISNFTRSAFAVKLRIGSSLSEASWLDIPQIEIVVLSGSIRLGDRPIPAWIRRRRVLLETTCEADARFGESAEVHGLIAKGNEAGGWVGEESTFILLQRLSKQFRLPVYAHGGIGLYSGAASLLCGASGFILDSQVLLAAESSLPPRCKQAIEHAVGDETRCISLEAGNTYRVFALHGMEGPERFQRLAEVERAISWSGPQVDIWPLGQDVAFAASLARQFRSVAGIVQGIRNATRRSLVSLSAHSPLAPHSSLAKSHGTRYPILQGPMTRVSDTPEFARAVADAGALPFLALAMMKEDQARPLLERTKQLLADQPWGVGILGFVPESIRQEQLDIIQDVRPPFAIVAGARPDRILDLEKHGVTTYLHVPSPELLRLFLREGVRRFVFEGRECGGHVGPRTSFVLWQMMVETLLEALDSIGPPDSLHLIFAGGIHDAVSAAAIPALAAPLVERGVRIGVLMGTAYLFTREAVATGAIVSGFQQAAIACKETALIESGGGHAIRCAVSPYAAFYQSRRERLAEQGKTPEEIRSDLENLNVGRLRLASKGLERIGAELKTASLEHQQEDGLYMLGQVAGLRDSVVSMNDLHADISREGTALLAEAGRRWITPVVPQSAAKQLDIAIVGMACLMPGAPNVQQFWSNIIQSVDAVREIPIQRFDVNQYDGGDGRPSDRIDSSWGGFLDSIGFDPLKYGIPPSALKSIEPMQLLALVTADAALRDAALATRDFDRSRTAVILGVSGGLGDLGLDFAVRAMLPRFVEKIPDELSYRLPQWSEDAFPGILINVTAGRISNRLNLGGTNFTVDAACGSSLAAVLAATHELAAGGCDMVIAGGVDTLQNAFSYLCFSATHALSPSGRCRTFDGEADGIVISEGVGMVVLKRLSDAERDGDRIYAVIRGIAGSSDGRDRSLTAPSAPGQVRVLRMAYDQAGFHPSTVDLIEAHGTGTVVGDAAELAALSEVFGEEATGRANCALGSVKSMIGHTKAAAGIAGLIKTALSLYHKTLPPTLHVKTPNAKLLESGSPFFVNLKPRCWVQRAAGTPRRAGVSAFGFGGTNFHAVLEEYCGDVTIDEDRPVAVEWPAELFVWRGSSVDELSGALEHLKVTLDRQPAAPLRLLARNVSRSTHQMSRGSWRLAIVARSPAALREQISAAQQQLRDQEVSFVSNDVFLANGPPASQVAFLFSGQGAQRINMFADLALYFPEFRRRLDQADRVLANKLPMRLSRMIYPPPAFSAQDLHASGEGITDTVIAQPALAVIEMALHDLLKRFGIRPDCTSGHSFGELVALWAAGVFSGDDLLELSVARGNAINGAHHIPGAMLAAHASEDVVSRLVADFPDIFVANCNGPMQTVLAGKVDALEMARLRLDIAGVQCSTVPVRYAFHSPLVAAAREVFASEIGRRTFDSPTLPVYSNVTAGQYPVAPDSIKNLLADHLVRPIRFHDQVQKLRESGIQTFIEVGPGRILTGLVRQILDGPGIRAIALDDRSEHGLVVWLRVLAELAVSGLDVQVEQLFRGRAEDASLLSGAPAEQPAWLVDGGRVRKAREPVSLEPPINLTDRIESRRDPEAEAVMSRYSNLMSQFLQVQSDVMQAYLTGTSSPVQVERLRVVEPSSEPVIPITPVQPAIAASDDPVERLMCIVSERTGYPRQILEGSALLEADLGIDSIKRVEIVGKFQDGCSEDERVRVREVFSELTRARTLDDLVKRLTNALPKPPASHERLVSSLPRTRLGITPCARIGSTHSYSGRVILITDDGEGLAHDLAEKWRAQGERPVLVQNKYSGREPDEHSIRADFTDIGAMRAAVEEVRRRLGAVDALVHVLPPELPAWQIPDLAETWRLMLRRDLYSLYALSRACFDDLRRAGRQGHGLLAVVTRRGGVFGIEDGTGTSPIHQGVADFVRTVAAELPELRCKVVDRGVSTAADQVFAELSSDERTLEVGLLPGQRITITPMRAPLDSGASRTFTQDSVFLLTGGARGITSALAKGIAARYRPRLIILGRTELSSSEQAVESKVAKYTRLERQTEVRSTIERLRRSGAEVEYHTLDVTRDDDLAALIDDVYARFGRIDVAIHGAGVIEDKLLPDKEPDSFDRVVRTKVDAAWVLARKLDWEKLRALVFLSSVSAPFGNTGQCDYAAANGLLNGFAQTLGRVSAGRVFSVNWGPWTGSGMADVGVLRQLRERGIEAISQEEGVQAFLSELECDSQERVVVLGNGPWCSSAFAATSAAAEK